MDIISTSVHLIDYENEATTKIEPPVAFEEYISELITHINSNKTIRAFTTASKRTEVITCVLDTHGNAEETERVQENAEIIARRLLLKEKEAQARIEHLDVNVQKGSLVQALIRDEEHGGMMYLLAKVEHAGFVDDTDFSFKSGFSKDKKTIWKTCIFDLSQIDGESIPAKIYSNTEAKYWWSDFLELCPVKDDAQNTQAAFKAIDSAVSRMIEKVAPYDHTVIRNAFVSHFKTADLLDYDNMVHTVLDNYHSDALPQEQRNALRDHLLTLPEEKEFDRQFTLVASAVNGRIKKEYPVYPGIKLQITNGIDHIADVIVSKRDPDGTEYLQIRTIDSGTFRRFYKEEQ